MHIKINKLNSRKSEKQRLSREDRGDYSQKPLSRCKTLSIRHWRANASARLMPIGRDLRQTEHFRLWSCRIKKIHSGRHLRLDSQLHCHVTSPLFYSQGPLAVRHSHHLPSHFPIFLINTRQPQQPSHYQVSRVTDNRHLVAKDFIEWETIEQAGLLFLIGSLSIKS